MSHRWEEGEIVFGDVSKVPLSNRTNPARTKRGFAKVIGTCTLANKDGFEWVWIDTCCIDKSSSAELQESVNSMFRWYQRAQICYAYLSDVADESSGWGEAFNRSLWFTRGWTLQELLAPYTVEFYSADWKPIGTKFCRSKQVASITGIEVTVLESDWVTTEDKLCAAQKLSWAAHRHVSKVEDKSYCLFGLFNVNLPLLYGEGEVKAFRRLQQSIFEESADHSLFLFTRSRSRTNTPMLADSIQRFCTNNTCGVCKNHAQCFSSEIIRYSEIVSNRSLWPAGLQDAHYIQLLRHSVMIKLPLVQYNSLRREERNSHNVRRPSQTVIAILPLSPRRDKHSLFGILLQQISLASYVRLSEKPLLLQEDMIGADPAELGAYTVHDTHPNLGIDSIGKIIPDYINLNWLEQYVKIKLHSATVTAEEWHGNTQGYPARACIGTTAQFPLPSHLQNHFSVTVSFRSVRGPRLTGTIILGNSVTQMELLEIRLSEGPNVDYHFLKRNNQNQRHMRVCAPIPNTNDSLDIALRKLPVTEVEFSKGENSKKSSRIDPASTVWCDFGILRYQYRLDINRLSAKNTSQMSSSQPGLGRSRI